MKLISLLTTLLLIVFFDNCLFGQGKKDEYILKIDSLLTANNSRKFNGVVVISQGGITKYAVANGFANLDTQEPLSLNTQFAIGSITKQMTAVLILQEAEEGYSRLTDPIKKYLLGIEQDWADTLPIHYLLNHTFGIVSINEPLAFKPGTKCAYSNLAYQLLAKIVEKTSSKTYESLVQALFKKCSMSSSFDPISVKDESSITKLASNYRKSRDGKLIRVVNTLQILDSVEAAGGIIATAPDIIKWNQCLHGGKLVNKGSYQLLTTPFSYAMRNHPVFDTLYYAYSIPVTMQDNITEYSHSGFLPNSGFFCVNLYYPATKTSVVVLENMVNDTDSFKNIYFYELSIRKIMRESKLVRANYR